MQALTPKFRVSYPNVFKAKRNELSGKDEYSVVALFTKDTDLAGLKATVVKVLEAELGADQKKWPKNLKLPFRDQGEKKKTTDEGKEILPSGHVEGAIFLNLKSKTKPGVVNAQVEDIIDEAEFYAGCWARASVNAYYYDAAGNKGVAFGLVNIQKVAEGDPLSGRTTAIEDFSPVTTTTKDASGLFS